MALLRWRGRNANVKERQAVGATIYYDLKEYLKRIRELSSPSLEKIINQST